MHRCSPCRKQMRQPTMSDCTRSSENVPRANQLHHDTDECPALAGDSESLSKLERRICNQLLRTASQWLQMTRTFCLRHPGHNSACLLRQLAAGIHIITPHNVIRVAVAAPMEVQEITTMQHVPLTDDMCVHVAVFVVWRVLCDGHVVEHGRCCGCQQMAEYLICEHQHMTFGRFF